MPACIEDTSAEQKRTADVSSALAAAQAAAARALEDAEWAFKGSQAQLASVQTEAREAQDAAQNLAQQVRGLVMSLHNAL